MKKKLLIAALVAGVFSTAHSQTFTNASFETWHNYTVGFLPPMNLTAPTGGWYGVDSLVAYVAPLATIGGINITAQQQLFQSNLAHSGTSSAEVRSAFIGTDVGNVPGIFANARINIDLVAAMAGNPEDILNFVSYDGGTAVTAQVDTVKAWVSLDSTTSMDEGFITATAVKIVPGSSGGDSTVVVGMGTAIVTRGTADFREFAIPLTYADNTVPEKLIVTFMSSNFAADTVHEGNSMKVDDVSYSYKPSSGVGIRQPLFSESKILVYPNPGKNQIYFNLDATAKPSDYSLSIFDINGRIISKEQLNNAVNLKDVSGWAKGSYFYTLTNDKNNTKEQGKFVVE
ncbi:T9SS type A sorting domain-containing protein [Taibaiella lutea]|nr:T9SS type A sorting domain-containing protein [Taibaiella lutea]